MKNLLNLFFPKVCFGCRTHLSDNEIYVCTSCRHELPVTNFHFENNDALKKILYGRVTVEHGTALLHFSKKGIVQELLHNLKYRRQESIGIFLGQWLGSELQEIRDYNTIDIIVPVPLHQSKLRKRGYNQVSKFAQEVALALNVEYNDKVLKKVFSSKTQVFKSRLKRWSDADTMFSLSPDKSLEGKHILLVDDIITTGATIEACANELLKIDNIKLSVATMAIAE